MERLKSFKFAIAAGERAGPLLRILFPIPESIPRYLFNVRGWEMIGGWEDDEDDNSCLVKC